MDPFNHNSLVGLTRPPSPTHPQDPSALSSVLHLLCLPPSHLYLLLDPLPPPKQHSSLGRTFPTWILARPGLSSLGSGTTHSNDSCLMVFRTLSACIYILFNWKYLTGKILKCKRDRKERKWTEVDLPPRFTIKHITCTGEVFSEPFSDLSASPSPQDSVLFQIWTLSSPDLHLYLYHVCVSSNNIRYCWHVFFFNVYKCYHSMFIQQSEIPGVVYFYLKH